MPKLHKEMIAQYERDYRRRWLPPRLTELLDDAINDGTIIAADAHNIAAVYLNGATNASVRALAARVRVYIKAAI